MPANMVAPLIVAWTGLAEDLEPGVVREKGEGRPESALPDITEIAHAAGFFAPEKTGNMAHQIGRRENVR